MDSQSCILAKPAAAACNLDCRYCYYLRRPEAEPSRRMSHEVLETLIRDTLAAHADAPEVHFAWLRETPLAELVRSRRQHEFGRRKLEPLPERCADCAYLAGCGGGCPRHRFVPALRGAPENYLCPSYRRFFRHCAPALARFAAVFRAGAPMAAR